MSAFAQTPSLSLPPLPPIPGTPSNLSALPSVNLPTVPQAPNAPDPSIAASNLPKVPDAPLAPLPGAVSPDIKVKTGQAAVVKGSATPVANAAANKPPADPEASADMSSSGVGAPGSLPPQGMPELPMPDAVAALPLPAISPLPLGIPDAPTALPEISVEREKPKVLSWQTKLAPSIIPPVTNFQYKREVLPESIYAAQYNRDNSHLPRRVTREDYEALLFASVAKNDIEATRALLNAGTGIEATNSYGETPLAVAKRSGATEVAQLLVARGAH